jgi:HAD superfamily hydrolase (TIGR01450 family)
VTSAPGGAALLAGWEAPLLDRYDGVLLDLDGVIQLDEQAIPEAPQALAQLAARGVPVAFVTNNAARTPEEVADRLRRLGVDAVTDQVVTSAVVAAELLAAEMPPGAPVLAVGGPGLRTAVEAVGLRRVNSADDEPVAVIQGWGPDVAWAHLAEACVALRAGCRWVVTNDDRTLPSPRGPLPGSGALVASLVTATGRQPDVVVGKPRAPLFAAARERVGGDRPLMVGDRLDTDIAGASAAGIATLLVFTGISRPADLLAAAPGDRPTHVGLDLRALDEGGAPVEVDGDRARCGKTSVTAAGGVSDDGDQLDGLRAAAALAWSGRLAPERYADVLRKLSLD